MVLFALLCAAGLVLVHAAADMSERSFVDHLDATAVLLAIIALAGLTVRSMQATTPEAVAETPEDARVAQLTREKQAAEAASAAKSRYITSVSHEIRSPLNAIYGYAQLMERGSAIDPAEAGRIIRRSAEHLTNLVDGLLDISLIENGMLRVSSDVVRLAPFLDQLADMFRHQATAKGLAFHDDRSQRLPEFVRMDEKRLKQVLINLLSNAVKFTPSGAVTLRSRWSGQIMTFEVRDTGPGIARADRERIFMPFERGECLEGGTQPGLGLGLAITRALVDIQGGEMEVESEPGAGAAFRVRLMMGQAAGVASDAGAPIAGYAGERRSILVVDDDPHQRALVQRLLEPFGFTITTAPDGPAALALCAAASFDLVMLDIAMPHMSGWEVARRLGARAQGRPRIMMLSGNAADRQGPEDSEPTHDRFLIKPAPLGALLDAIGDLLALRWVHETPVEAPAHEIVRGERAPLPEAARPHADKLRELLRIGHVRGIEAEIRAIADTAPGSEALIGRLYACLDRFDLPALGAALDDLQ